MRGKARRWVRSVLCWSLRTVPLFYVSCVPTSTLVPTSPPPTPTPIPLSACEAPFPSDLGFETTQPPAPALSKELAAFSGFWEQPLSTRDLLFPDQLVVPDNTEQALTLVAVGLSAGSTSAPSGSGAASPATRLTAN